MCHVYFKPERVCTSSVVEMGLNKAAVEDVVAEKRREDDTMSESSHSEKILEVETEEEFYTNTGRPIRTVKRTTWKTSGATFFHRHVLLFLVVEIQLHSG